MIKLSVCPPFRDDWTEVLIVGEHEAEVASVLVARLQYADFEVEAADEEGEMLFFEEIKV